jgi:hypothetical protein
MSTVDRSDIESIHENEENNNETESENEETDEEIDGEERVPIDLSENEISSIS